jgi:hypothetical protein
MDDAPASSIARPAWLHGVQGLFAYTQTADTARGGASGAAAHPTLAPELHVGPAFDVEQIWLQMEMHLGARRLLQRRTAAGGGCEEGCKQPLPRISSAAGAMNTPARGAARPPTHS